MSQIIKNTNRAPAFFVGHGNPMNAIENNDFTRSLSNLGKSLDKPKAILAISAHWYMPYSAVSLNKKEKLVYDMYGFPDKLYDVKYEVDNSEFIISKLKSICKKIRVEDRGLDHGVWSILVHLFPDADIPVTQFSINSDLNFKEHFELGETLRELRDEGVMIIGSGNITHNLHMVNWSKNAKAEAWALDFDNYIKESVLKRDFEALIDIQSHKYFDIAHPTLEHYIPLLYVLGSIYKEDSINFIYEEIEMGTMSMRNLLLS